MTARRNIRFFLLLLTAALFALHIQLVPRVGHAAEHQTVSATTIIHVYNGDCHGGCCRGTACCIQAALFQASVLSPPPSDRLGFATKAAMPMMVVKPLYPPPKAASA